MRWVNGQIQTSPRTGKQVRIILNSLGIAVNVLFHVVFFIAEVHMQLSVFSSDGEWQEIPPSSCPPPPLCLQLPTRKAAPWCPPVHPQVQMCTNTDLY